MKEERPDDADHEEIEQEDEVTLHEATSSNNKQKKEDLFLRNEKEEKGKVERDLPQTSKMENNNNSNNNSLSAEEDFEVEEGDGEEDSNLGGTTTSTPPTNVTTTTTTATFTCDMCGSLVFESYDALMQHVESKHADLIPDAKPLQEMADKIAPHISDILKGKGDDADKSLQLSFTECGKKVFEVAAQRDAGRERLAEACAARAQLEVVVRHWQPKASVFIFGSSVVMGLWDGLSDIDFAVVEVEEFERGEWPPNEKPAVRVLAQLLRQAGFSYQNLEAVENARVPIIKHHAAVSPLHFLQKDTQEVVSRSVRFLFDAPLDTTEKIMFEQGVKDVISGEPEQVWWDREGRCVGMTLGSTYDAMRVLTHQPAVSRTRPVRCAPLHDEYRPELYRIDFDLSFRAFGIRNSLLLRHYLTAHPCGRPGALILKEWSKSSGVNNSIMGFLTSYAINILWIFFLLQKGHVPFLNPQDVPHSLLQNSMYDPVYSPLVPPNLNPTQKESLYEEMGQLLVGFFAYYCFEFNWDEDVVSLNRPGVTSKATLNWTTESTLMNKPGKNVRYQMCIEDPYEDNLNLGRHLGECRCRKIKAEFQRGLASLLKDTPQESCVFSWVQNKGPSRARDPPVEVVAAIMAVAIDVVERTDEIVTVTQLREAFEERVPEQFKIVSKFWKWNQLLHRLGYKQLADRVTARRSVGSKQPKKAEAGGLSRFVGAMASSHSQPLLDLADQIIAEFVREQSSGEVKQLPQWVVWTPPKVTMPGHRLSTDMKVSPSKSSLFHTMMLPMTGSKDTISRCNSGVVCGLEESWEKFGMRQKEKTTKVPSASAAVDIFGWVFTSSSRRGELAPRYLPPPSCSSPSTTTTTTTSSSIATKENKSKNFRHGDGEDKGKTRTTSSSSFLSSATARATVGTRKLIGQRLLKKQPTTTTTEVLKVVGLPQISQQQMLRRVFHLGRM